MTVKTGMICYSIFQPKGLNNVPKLSKPACGDCLKPKRAAYERNFTLS